MESVWGNIYCETKSSEEASEQFIGEGGLQAIKKCIQVTDQRNRKWFFTMVHVLSNVASFLSLRRHFMRADIINCLLGVCQSDGGPISGVSIIFTCLIGFQDFQIHRDRGYWDIQRDRQKAL